MTSGTTITICALSAMLVMTPLKVSAQTDITYSGTTRVSSGATIQPVFEGWEKNPDGSFSLWFGYLNRNWAEEISLAIGTGNNIEPGGPDRGQPTFFQTGERKRRQMFAFRVVVPADWPKDRDVIWTLTTQGQALKAYGSLWPVWMIDGNVISANRGAQRDTDPVDKNSPPKITQAPNNQTITLGRAVPLTVAVSDDGMPKPLREREAGGSRINERGDTDYRSLLRVTWLQWRGPGRVNFDPEVVPITDPAGQRTRTVGSATTRATFDKPGVYVLRVYAEDMSLFSTQDVTVTVTADSKD